LIPIASALLYKAAKNNSALVSDLIQFKQFDETTQTIRLSVRPIISKIHERFMLLCFEKAVQIHCETNLPEIHLASETIERIEILENELAASRESLQATIEELETSNEELQATNEELMASNEELQSSNEELQSVNEELNTVNAEYQEKAVILSQLNADLDSMAKASGVATIFVDEKLNLTRFSQDAIQIFKLRNSDVGRRLDDFAHNLKYTQLINDIQNTLKCQSMTEREVLSQDGRTFLVRILPYSMPFARTQGAVASFIDITAFHDAQRLQAILDALYEHIAVLDRDGNILLTNQAWKQFSIYHGDSELIYSDIGSNYFQSCKNSQYKHPLLIPQAIEGIQSILQNDQPFFSLKYPFKIANQLQWFAMNVVPIHKSFNQHQCSAVVSHINISTWYQSADIEDNND
jgi:two-component system CheB/CheR fusion protein